MATLRFERAELVTANYYYNFTEDQMEDFINYVENNYGEDAFNAIKDVTFADWCAIAAGEREDVTWENAAGADGSWHYICYGQNVLCDYLRDLALENDDVSYDYNDMYDDSWEELTLKD